MCIRDRAKVEKLSAHIDGPYRDYLVYRAIDEIDVNTIKKFLGLVSEDFGNDVYWAFRIKLYVYIWGESENLYVKKSKFDDIVEYILEHYLAEVYFSFCPHFEPNHRAESVVECQWLFYDIDNVNETVLRNLSRLSPRPVVILYSGHGAHLYYKLSRKVRTEEYKKIWQRFAKRYLTQYLNKIDKTKSGPYVLARLPGTLNCKDPENPVRTIAIFQEGDLIEVRI
ncbi:hypothetical protein [Sulfolobus acidocaldarius]|uniref:hypothetical protein n=1 Tax=Sulfolobus acidocaldarius TaxID=2285 RepID=UPI000ADDB5C9|nr:hypothetical protein [Sulfolobus acidocaldarius]